MIPSKINILVELYASENGTNIRISNLIPFSFQGDSSYSYILPLMAVRHSTVWANLRRILL